MSGSRSFRQWFRYWVSDVIFGIANYITHYSLRYVPFWLNSTIGKLIGQLAGKYRFHEKTERARHNLELLRPGLSEQETDRFITTMWGNIGKAMCEYSILDKLWKQGRVHIENTRVIDECIERGQAIIFTGAHLGNWEAQASYVVEHNIPLMAMYKPVRNRFSKMIADRARDRMKIITVPTDRHAIRAMCDHLSKKHALWLPIDDFKNNQVHFPRFGRPMALKGTNASHIVRLAERYHAAIIPVRTRRRDTLSPQIDVRLYDAVQVGDGKIDEALDMLDQMIEQWVLEDLQQWYMLHELRM
jgi:KDO2-lipid IV(A) lauroyltransferase